MSKIVRVDWFDANADTSGWQSRKRAKTHSICNNSTVGFIIKRNLKQITVAQSIGEDSCDALISIPRVNIISVKELDEKKD